MDAAGQPSQADHQHATALLTEVVYLEPGTVQDEEYLKWTGRCPKCDEPLVDSIAVALELDPDKLRELGVPPDAAALRR